MPVARASRELLATPDDVWQFLAEPYHLTDWWPGLGAVEPDRRGVAVGARWRVRRSEASFFRKAQAEDTLLVTAAEPGRRFAFELVHARIRADLTLAPAGGGLTRAELAVEGPLVLVFSKSVAKTALARLHDLCQSAATI
jgi:uncharacterized protein YndB with AHSA1/START domain